MVLPLSALFAAGHALFRVRGFKLLEIGASTRSILQLVRLAQGYALVQKRAYVIPDDIKLLAQLVLPHRWSSQCV